MALTDTQRQALTDLNESLNKLTGAILDIHNNGGETTAEKMAAMRRAFGMEEQGNAQ